MFNLNYSLDLIVTIIILVDYIRHKFIKVMGSVSNLHTEFKAQTVPLTFNHELCHTHATCALIT